MQALSMVLQMGLSMLICMGMSLAIGFYLDKLFGTGFFVPVMTVIGILAAIRSMLILTGKYNPLANMEKEKEEDDSRENTDSGNH